MITLIIPCFNEESNISLILKNINLFHKKKHLVVDGGSNDNSKILYIKNRINFLITKPSRGFQQKKGAEACKTKWLFFLHADTELNSNNILDIENFVCKCNNYEKIAFFSVSFREKTFSAKLVSLWANLRTSLFKLPFGDQGLIIGRDYYFKLGGHSKKKIMEDLDLIVKVPKRNRILLKSKVFTSFRSYEKNGVILQGAVHLLCQIMFFLKFKEELIYKVYKYYEK